MEAECGQLRGALAAQEGGNEALDRGRQRATLSTHLEVKSVPQLLQQPCRQSALRRVMVQGQTPAYTGKSKWWLVGLHGRA